MFTNRPPLPLDHTIDIYAPHSAGSFPTMLFFPGMSCMVPATVYSDILTHIASWGYVVVGPSRLLFSPEENYKADWVDPLLQYLLNHPPTTYPSSNLHPDLNLDLDTLILSAQSSGSHVAVNWLTMQSSHCSSTKAMILLSAVDGVDPFGMIDSYCVHPPALTNFRVSTLLLSGGLDSVQGAPLFPACAPKELGTSRFYNALAGPTLLVNSTRYGHVDCMDEDMVDIVQNTHFCKTDPDTDKEAYKRDIGSKMISFLHYIMNGECSLWSEMVEGEEGVEDEVSWKGGVETEEVCGNPRCEWQDGPFESIQF